ncbi:MAG TPA: anthranilate phosphoribosyltransferase, partial [Marmoricola sp.]|nr:anthranilate phosphoribosyltransferase [Marmoricola sp.]
VRDLLAGERGAVRDAVLLNAGAALAVYQAGTGSWPERIAAGLEQAAGAIDSGAAATKLKDWVDTTKAFG